MLDDTSLTSHYNSNEDSNNHKMAPSLLQYYRKLDPLYSPTRFKQTYEEFQKGFELRQVSEQRLKDYRIIMRRVPINSKVPLSQTVSLCDWVNMSEVFGDEIRKDNPFTKCMDARLFIEHHSKTYDKANYIVLLGVFELKITVRNVDRVAPEVKDEEYVSKGGFGFIAKEVVDGKVRVRKRIFFSRVGDEDYCSKREKLEDIVR